MALCVVPLTAFQCVPAPLIRASSESSSLTSETTPHHSQPQQVFDRAAELAKNFATQFDLKNYGDCPRGWYGIAQSDPCVSYWRMKDEGIMILVSYNSESRKSNIVLVKEARVFGNFTKRELEEQFQKVVLVPLTREFGEQLIRVER